MIHEASGYSEKVQLALILDSNLPSFEQIKRWMGENIAFLVIPHDCFMLNSASCTVLPPNLAQTIFCFMQNTNCGIAVVPAEDINPKCYSSCIKRIANLVDNYLIKYANCFSLPLQPLQDNLSSVTYELFESDPAKYVLYQKAIEGALMEIPGGMSRKIVVLIVGAGRGPLVSCTIEAGKKIGCKLRLFVVEKNPNAIVTLSSLIDDEWSGEDVTLISEDMREVELKEKADVLVSEMLGSFGDNELSPECLDGAQKQLKPGGISIPCNSVAYLQPIMSKPFYLHLASRTVKDCHRNWLGLLLNSYSIDDAKEAWRFVHPNHDEVIDNERSTSLQFTAKLDCILHGFTGYFTSKLFKDIQLSIHPESYTPGMFSWYSIIFPLSTPCHLSKGEIFTLKMWRRVEANVKVWYEYEVKNQSSRQFINRDGWADTISLRTRRE
jgi:type II protein arginine methyltransferase